MVLSSDDLASMVKFTSQMLQVSEESIIISGGTGLQLLQREGFDLNTSSDLEPKLEVRDLDLVVNIEALPLEVRGSYSENYRWVPLKLRPSNAAEGSSIDVFFAFTPLVGEVRKVSFGRCDFSICDPLAMLADQVVRAAGHTIQDWEKWEKTLSVLGPICRKLYGWRKVESVLIEHLANRLGLSNGTAELMICEVDLFRDDGSRYSVLRWLIGDDAARRFVAVKNRARVQRNWTGKERTMAFNGELLRTMVEGAVQQAKDLAAQRRAARLARIQQREAEIKILVDSTLAGLEARVIEAAERALSEVVVFRGCGGKGSIPGVADLEVEKPEYAPDVAAIAVQFLAAKQIYERLMDANIQGVKIEWEQNTPDEYRVFEYSIRMTW